MNCQAVLELEEKPDFYDGKSCAYCGCRGIVKKHTLHFKHSYKAKMCYHCIEKLKGNAKASVWLEQTAKFDSNGHVYFPKNND